MNQSLEAKEQLYGLQQQLLYYSPVVVQVGLNMPGGYLLYPWQEVERVAVRAVRADFLVCRVEPVSEITIDTAVGPYCLFAVRADGFAVKERMVQLEERYAIGRLWDIDVLSSSGPIDRNMLGLPPRKCLVCSGDAHVCRREGKHRLADVIKAAQTLIEGEGL